MSVFLTELWLIDDLEPKSAALNMAMDEALLGEAKAPTLRFYRWRTAALSFGYFGKFSDVSTEESTREIVRRWTGGGVVRHGDDLTYSFVLPAEKRTSAPGPHEVYRALHESIAEVLRAAHITATVAASDAPKRSDSCFANPVRADVLIGAQKVAGAAQRRTRKGLLHQGSIQGLVLPDRFPTQFARALSQDFRERDLSPEVERRAEILASEKYTTEAWLRRR
ncbi:MAG: hypothetical protein H0U99_05155 [Chthoniobacterales bacterium]|nr:hypothetical protein [Chthoniobacterales bacterium]